jgi:two-component sensor histidine kinase
MANFSLSTLTWWNSDKRICVDVTPSPVRVTPQQVNSLALVINELATNAVKYALPERRRAHISVRIALGDEDDAVLFEFRDDGPGYPAEVLQLERHNVGLYLTQIVVRDDLEGELALHNEHGAVTTVRFKKDPAGF